MGQSSRGVTAVTLLGAFSNRYACSSGRLYQQQTDTTRDLPLLWQELRLRLPSRVEWSQEHLWNQLLKEPAYRSLHWYVSKSTLTMIRRLLIRAQSFLLAWRERGARKIPALAMPGKFLESTVTSPSPHLKTRVSCFPPLRRYDHHEDQMLCARLESRTSSPLYL